MAKKEEKFVDKLDNIKDTGVGIVDSITSIPKKGSQFFNELNNKLITLAQDFENESAQVARKNLKDQKVRGISGKVGSWIMDNKLLAGAGVLILIIIVRRL